MKRFILYRPIEEGRDRIKHNNTAKLFRFKGGTKNAFAQNSDHTRLSATCKEEEEEEEEEEEDQPAPKIHSIDSHYEHHRI